MSWFDDPDLEAAFDDLPSEVSIAMESPDFDVPKPGDVIGGRYRVVSIISDARLLVRHTRIDQTFLLRLLPRLQPGNQFYERLEFVTDVAGLLSNDLLGFVAEFSICPRFGGFAVCENVSGNSLTDLIDATPAPRLELEEALGFMVDLGGILSELHDVGVAHGMLDGDDIVRDDAGRWRLLAPGVPCARITIGPPPHVTNQLQATPQSDQWALAFSVYALLVGEVPEGAEPLAPSDLRADIPIALDDTILRALQLEPDDRFDSIEDFVAAFQNAIVQWRTPLGESSAVLSSDSLFGLHPDAESSLAEESFARSRLAARSVVIGIEALATPRVQMSFQNITRLRTECRRNIVAGGLFVPGATNLKPGQNVEVTLSYDPAGREVVARANVSQVSTTDPTGAALLFEPGELARIKAFVRDVDPAADLNPKDRLIAARALDLNAQISAAEAFLLSRLGGTIELGHLRAFFNGLPFDFDETVVALIDKNFIQVERHSAKLTSTMPRRAETRPAAPGAQMVDRPFAPTNPRVNPQPAQTAQPAQPAQPQPTPPLKETAPQPQVASKPLSPESKPAPRPALPKIEMSRDEIEILLDKATVFEARGNYRAAIEILQNALNSKKDARLWHRIAVLRARFQGAYGRALRELEKAAALSPGNPEITASQHWLEALIDTEAIQHLFKQGFANARFKFLRLDPDIHRAWVEVESSSERRIVGIDFGRNRVQSNQRASDPRTFSAVTGNHPRLAALESRLPQTANTLRLRRQKIAELARTSDDYGPWFRQGPTPAACAPNSSFLVFDGHPTTRQEGLFVVQENTTMSPLKIEKDGTRGVRPAIAPDATGAVVFSTHGPIQAVWIAELFQAPREILSVSGESSALWQDNQTLLVLEHRSGRILKTGRKGGDVREIAQVGASRSWVSDPEVEAVACIGTGDRKLTRVLLKDGSTTEFEFPDPIKHVLLRNDGFAAALSPTGIWLLDFNHRRKRHITADIHPSSFHDNTWLPKQPLILMLNTSDTIELVSLDPAVLL